jgi:hypothetical protein
MRRALGEAISESPGGISPPGAPRTVQEPLDSDRREHQLPIKPAQPYSPRTQLALHHPYRSFQIRLQDRAVKWRDRRQIHPP